MWNNWRIDVNFWLLGNRVVSNNCLSWLIWYWKRLTDWCKLLTSRGQCCFKHLSRLNYLILEAIDGLTFFLFDIGSDWRIDVNFWLFGNSVDSNNCLGWLIWYWKAIDGLMWTFDFSGTALFQITVSAEFNWYWKRLTDWCKLLTSREQSCFKHLSQLIDLILEGIDGLM